MVILQKDFYDILIFKKNMTTVNIETNHGNISLNLFPELAPETVRNFEKLVRDGFYNGTLFH